MFMFNQLVGEQDFGEQGTFGLLHHLVLLINYDLWSHDNFGEDLIINPKSGSVFYYYWDKTNGTETLEQ